MIKRVQMLVDELYPQLVLLRRTLHENPELSDQEFQTVAQISRYLDEANISYEKLANMNAIVGQINGQQDGKVIGLRADMDALPIQEQNQTSYCSKVPGVMHACGHDVHTTVLVGAALVLNQLRDEFNGLVKLFFQPAEETDGGAARMIEAGCLKNPTVDHVLGLHVHPNFEVGKIGLCYDKAHAASDMITIHVQGMKAHGAYPDEGIDAIVVSAQIITALQTLVSRCTSPFNPVVLSIGTIHGGDTGNVIASEVEMKGIIRTFDANTRELMRTRLKEVCESVAAAHHAHVEIEIKAGYCALVNDASLVEHVKGCAIKLLGSKNIVMQQHGSLGVEDFAYFAEAVPSCFYNLGTGNVEKNITSGLHSDTFDVDEEAIRVGVALQVLLTLSLLGVEI